MTELTSPMHTDISLNSGALADRLQPEDLKVSDTCGCFKAVMRGRSGYASGEVSSGLGVQIWAGEPHCIDEKCFLL